MKRRLTYACAALAIGLAWSGVACASAAKKDTGQDRVAARAKPAADSGQGSGAASSGGIAEIVVYAQRIREGLQHVAVADTPLTAGDLGTRKLHDLTQIKTAIPSLETTNDNEFTLRGIGSQIFRDNVRSSVGVMVDDVSLGVPLFMSNGAFVDMQQVEVLTGPQGLLFGANTSAGLINIITKKPRLGEFGGNASFEYDDRDTAAGGHFGIVATGVLNVPVSSDSALRLDLLHSVQDPLAKATIAPGTKNVQLQQTRTMVKLKYLWEPSDAFSLYFIGDYSRERGIGGIWDGTYLSAGAGGVDLPATKADGCTPGPNNLCFGAGAPDFRSVDTGGASLNLKYRISSALTLRNILAWRHYLLDYNYDTDITTTNILDVNAKRGIYNQYSDELRLAINSGRLNGQVGLFAFFSTDNASALFDGSAGTPFPHVIYGTNNYRLKGRSLAAYGQFNFHLTDDLQLIAGGRLTNDHISVHAKADNFANCFATPFPHGPCFPHLKIFGPLGQDYYATGDNTNFSYKVGAQYNIARDVMAYVTYSTGYKGPALVTSIAFTGQNPYLKPETVEDTEIGLKSFFFDHRMRLNIAGYIESFKNFQTQTFTSTGINYFGNAQGMRSSGVDVNTTLKPLPALTLSYNGAFQDAHFTKYSTDPCYFGQTTHGCSSTQLFFEGAGLSTPTAAHYTHTVQASYDIPVGASYDVTLEGHWYHRSSINYSSSGAPFEEFGPVDTYGASLTLRSDAGYDISVFCKNCTDKRVPSYLQNDPADAGIRHVLSVYQRWDYNSVRTIGVALNYQF